MKLATAFLAAAFLALLIGLTMNQLQDDKERYIFDLPKLVFELGPVECGAHVVEIAIVNKSNLANLSKETQQLYLTTQEQARAQRRGLWREGAVSISHEGLPPRTR